MKQSKRAVLFDWDLTLSYTPKENSSSERISHQLELLGAHYTPERIASAIQKRKQLITTGEYNGKLELQTRRDIVHFYQQILKLLGHSDTSWNFANSIYSQFASLPMALYEDVMPTLTLLSNMDISVGIISNTGVGIRRVIEKCIGDLMPCRHIIISQEVGVHKPAAKIWHLAVSRVGIPSRDCFYVGDNLKVDAVGSVRNGAFGRGVWLDRVGANEELFLPERVTRIHSLCELLDLV